MSCPRETPANTDGDIVRIAGAESCSVKAATSPPGAVTVTAAPAPDHRPPLTSTKLYVPFTSCGSSAVTFPEEKVRVPALSYASGDAPGPHAVTTQGPGASCGQTSPAPCHTMKLASNSLTVETSPLDLGPVRISMKPVLTVKAPAPPPMPAVPPPVPAAPPPVPAAPPPVPAAPPPVPDVAAAAP